MKSVRQKVCAYPVEQWERHDNMTFNIELNRQDVADLLSIPRSSLSRELCRLRDDGLISFYKYTFKIHNLFQLQKYANNTEQ
jgi:CRP-like cAMP-binding protein